MEEWIIGQLISVPLGAAIGSLIGAIFLQLATRWVCRFKPPYGMAYKAFFFGSLASYIVGMFAGVATRETGNDLFLLAIAIGFLVTAAIYGAILEDPDSGPIGFGKACLVSLVLPLIGMVIWLILILAIGSLVG